MTRKKVVCIDLDGVIADYSKGYQGPGTFGELMPGVNDALARLKREGWHIIILTARKDDELPLVRLYLLNNMIPYDSLTGRKPNAHAYVDDRGVRFDGDWEATLREILAFEPYYYRKAADQ